MALKTTINNLLKTAMRSKDETAVSCFRLLNSSIKNKEIDLRKEVTEEEVMKLIQGQVKQRQESIAAFKLAGRTEMVVKEEKELALLTNLLPKSLEKEELVLLIKQTIQETKATSNKEFGVVMKALMPKLQGRADGKVASNLVKELLPS